jgi:phosphoribosylglycinamide formyltransferase-1
MKQLAILLSGRGSNFEAIAQHIDRGELKARIAVVVSNVEGAAGVERARQRGLDVFCLSSRGMSREAFDRRVVSVLQEKKVDLVCLAGFMRLLSPFFIHTYRHRILNIHPSLLPSFPGLDAAKQALDHGVKVSGCTVHFVDEGLDSGPIILQAVVPVFDTDTESTLSSRILAEEHRLYSKAIQLLLDDTVKIEGRRVVLTRQQPFPA